MPSSEECRVVKQVKGAYREVSWGGAGDRYRPSADMVNCKYSSNSSEWVESRVYVDGAQEPTCGQDFCLFPGSHAKLSASLLLPLAIFRSLCLGQNKKLL